MFLPINTQLKHVAVRNCAVCPYLKHAKECHFQKTEIQIMRSPDDLPMTCPLRKVSVLVTWEPPSTTLSTALPTEIEPESLCADFLCPKCGQLGTIEAEAEDGPEIYADMATYECIECGFTAKINWPSKVKDTD